MGRAVSVVGWGALLVQEGQRQVLVLAGSRGSMAERELVSEAMERQRAGAVSLEQVLSEHQRQHRRMAAILARVHSAADTLQVLLPVLLPPLSRLRPLPGLLFQEVCGCMRVGRATADGSAAFRYSSLYVPDQVHP
ncbi:hypothetical protein JH26_04920 [Microvirga sp. BSC39]|nr:hypothetical protein JH26_04920 [Microvirga sp. BSC39]